MHPKHHLCLHHPLRPLLQKPPLFLLILKLAPKRKAFEPIGANNMLMTIHTLPKSPKDMLSSISKSVINDFETKHIRKDPCQSTRATRSNSIKLASVEIPSVETPCVTSFEFPSNSFRHYLAEDFIVAETSTETMISLLKR